MLLSFNSYHVISKPVVFCMYLVQRTLKTGWRQNSSLYSECLMCCYTDLLTALRIQFHVIGRSGFCVFSLLRRCDTVFVALTGYIFWYQRIVVNSYQRNNLQTVFLKPQAKSSIKYFTYSSFSYLYIPICGRNMVLFKF